MKALLRADLYRLLHSKFFYILAAVALALALVTFGLLVLIQTLASEMAGEALGLSVSAFQRLSFDGTVGYFSVIASAVFICGDYAGGGIRGKIVIGIDITKVVSVVYRHGFQSCSYRSCVHSLFFKIVSVLYVFQSLSMKVSGMRQQEGGVL